jgi:glutamine amidotransferase
LATSCVVVDYGIGNVFSVMQAMRDFPVECSLSSDHEEIRSADRLILPGVGAFGRAASRLRELGLEDQILEFIATGRPFLGICVGMQLLHDIGREFGEHRGLGAIGGSVEEINLADEGGKKVRVPLIGWHPLLPPHGDYARWDDTPLETLPRDSAFYFVHSFASRPLDPDNVLAITRHGGNDLTAAVHSGNVLGTQFHPERSAQAGRAFLQAFLKV